MMAPVRCCWPTTLLALGGKARLAGWASVVHGLDVVAVGVEHEGGVVAGVVLEAEAARVTDRPTLEQVAALYRAGEWPAEVEGDAFTAPFSAPSAGPPPWHLYRFRFQTASGVATAEPYGATRWRFDR